MTLQKCKSNTDIVKIFENIFKYHLKIIKLDFKEMIGNDEIFIMELTLIFQH